jgi:hypothetical protein
VAPAVLAPSDEAPAAKSKVPTLRVLTPPRMAPAPTLAQTLLGFRVETKMHFSVFAKMRKSCENGQIFATNFRENFCENFIYFSRKFSRERKKPIFAKTKNAGFCKNECYFLQNFCKNKNILLKI